MAQDGSSLQKPKQSLSGAIRLQLLPTICKQSPQRSSQPCLGSFAQQQQIQLTDLFLGLFSVCSNNSKADLDKTQITYLNIHYHHLFPVGAHLPYLTPLASPKEQHK